MPGTSSNSAVPDKPASRPSRKPPPADHIAALRPERVAGPPVQQSRRRRCRTSGRPGRRRSSRGSDGRARRRAIRCRKSPRLAATGSISASRLPFGCPRAGGVSCSALGSSSQRPLSLGRLRGRALDPRSFRPGRRSHRDHVVGDAGRRSGDLRAGHGAAAARLSPAAPAARSARRRHGGSGMGLGLVFPPSCCWRCWPMGWSLGESLAAARGAGVVTVRARRAAMALELSATPTRRGGPPSDVLHIPAGPARRCRDHRHRCDPQLLGAAPGRQDRRHSRPCERPADRGRSARRLSMGSAPNSAAPATRPCLHAWSPMTRPDWAAFRARRAAMTALRAPSRTHRGLGVAEPGWRGLQCRPSTTPISARASSWRRSPSSLIGGVLAMLIRAQLATPAQRLRRTRDLQPDLHHAWHAS